MDEMNNLNTPQADTSENTQTEPVNIPVMPVAQGNGYAENPYMKIRRAGLAAGLALVSMFAAQIVFSVIYSIIGLLFGTPDPVTGVKMISDTSALYFFLHIVQYIVMFLPPLVIVAALGKTKGMFSLFEKQPLPPESIYDAEENEKYQVKLEAHKKLKSRMLPEALLLLPVAVGGSYAMSVVSSYLKTAFNMFGLVSPEIFSNNPVDALGWVFYFIVTCVLAPVFEEMFFRGAVLKMLTPYGKGFAIACQAILFAVFHGTLAQIPYTLVGGLIMGYLAVRYGGILPSILLHFFNNLFSMLITLCIPQSIQDNMFYNIIINITIYTVMIVGGIIAVKVLTKKDRSFFVAQTEDETPVADRLYGFSAFNAFLAHPAVLVYMIANIGMMLLTMLMTGLGM